MSLLYQKVKFDQIVVGIKSILYDLTPVHFYDHSCKVLSHTYLHNLEPVAKNGFVTHLSLLYPQSAFYPWSAGSLQSAFYTDQMIIIIPLKVLFHEGDLGDYFTVSLYGVFFTVIIASALLEIII